MVILDISMPGLTGIEVALWIRKSYPDIKVLVLTIHRDRTFLNQALCAGAEGYLLKEHAYTELFSAIEVIRKGGVFISPFLRSGPSDSQP
jgi:DNA-binding NarL/FixJ family response regulator